jgi:hypothetical protein
MSESFEASRGLVCSLGGTYIALVVVGMHKPVAWITACIIRQ